MMDTNSPPPADPVERRIRRRAACALDVTVRQRGRFAVAGATGDLTTHGCRLSGAGPFLDGGELWVRLPGIESQAARVVWSQGQTTGVAFAQPLHPAVYARFLPAEERMTLVGEPTTVSAMPADMAGLSRREQIVRGFGGSEPGPLTLGKKPVGGGTARDSAADRRAVPITAAKNGLRTGCAQDPCGSRWEQCRPRCVTSPRAGCGSPVPWPRTSARLSRSPSRGATRFQAGSSGAATTRRG